MRMGVNLDGFGGSIAAGLHHLSYEGRCLPPPSDHQSTITAEKRIVKFHHTFFIKALSAHTFYPVSRPPAIPQLFMICPLSNIFPLHLCLTCKKPH